MSALAIVALLLAEVDPEEAEEPRSAVETSWAVPLALGATLSPSVNGVAGRLFFGARPAISVQLPRAYRLGFGAYALAATLRSFGDFGAGGGLEVTLPWPYKVRPVVSGGALATVDARGWLPCLEAGLYYGVHSSKGAMAIFGLRADVRVWLQGEPRWVVTFAAVVDLAWPVQLVRILVS